MSSSAAMAASRARHPSARWRTPLGALGCRLRSRLLLRGVEHPEVAVAVLRLRGHTGETIDDFARRCAVRADVVVRAEAGELGCRALPLSLRQQVEPMLDRP